MAKSYRSNPWYLDVHFLTNHQRASIGMQCGMQHYGIVCCHVCQGTLSVSKELKYPATCRGRSLFEWPSNYFNQGTHSLMVTTPEKNVLEFPPKSQKQVQKKDVWWLKHVKPENHQNHHGESPEKSRIKQLLKAPPKVPSVVAVVHSPGTRRSKYRASAQKISLDQNPPWILREKHGKTR